MNLIKTILLLILAMNIVFAQSKPEFLKSKAKIGFVNSEDKIKEYKFIDNGKKLLLIGQKNIQLWDVENAKLLNSVPHQISEFTPGNSFISLITFGLSEILRWSNYEIEPNGRWIITTEKNDDKKTKSAIIRDLQTAKQIAKLDLPTLSVDYISFDKGNNEISTFGKQGKLVEIMVWDGDTFQPKGTVSIDEYKWHQFIKNGDKVLVGSGNTKTIWNGMNIKQGDNLTLRDVKTGAIEKEFTASSLIPKSYYQETTVSRDGKFLMSKRDKRIFVWEIDGDGSPKYEISSVNPKSDLEFIKLINDELIVVSVDKTLRIYEFGGDGKPKYEFSSTNPKTSFNLVDSSKNGKYFAIGGNGKTSFYETKGNGQPISEITPPEGFYTSISFLEDENYYVLSTYPKKGESVRSMFYNIQTGKLDFEIPFGIGSKVNFTPDKKFLYTEVIGKSYVWNFSENRFISIPLKTQTTSCSSDDTNCTSETYNHETTLLSPNSKFIIRHSYDLVSLFDIETGKEIEKIFDPQKVKYDSQNRIKESGYGKVMFSENGEYLFALGDGNQTITIWDILN